MINMCTKPIIKIQKELRTNKHNNILKSFKLPAKTMSKVKKLSSIKDTKQIEQQLDFVFEIIIMPKIEEAIYFTNRRINSSDPQYLNIIEYSGNIKQQKIFLIKCNKTNKDWIRFYVRIQNSMVEGNYSFFYYTFEDNFTTHYNLGEIYWSKTIC